MIWTQPNNKHTWAFIHYCRRQGDQVEVTITCGCGKKLCGHDIEIKVDRKNIVG